MTTTVPLHHRTFRVVRLNRLPGNRPQHPQMTRKILPQRHLPPLGTAVVLQSSIRQVQQPASHQSSLKVGHVRRFHRHVAKFKPVTPNRLCRLRRSLERFTPVRITWCSQPSLHHPCQWCRLLACSMRCNTLKKRPEWIVSDWPIRCRIWSPPRRRRRRRDPHPIVLIQGRLTR